MTELKIEITIDEALLPLVAEIRAQAFREAATVRLHHDMNPTRNMMNEDVAREASWWQNWLTEVNQDWKDSILALADAERAEYTLADLARIAEATTQADRIVELLEALPETSERGFRYTEIPFRDYRNSPERKLSVQESSLATERKLWVGVDTVYVDLLGNGGHTLMERAHLDEEAVRKLRDTLTAWLEA